jgi:tetratricopeptide (TPR) repeat protein
VSLAATVGIATARLAAEDPAASDLLRLGSFFGPDPIPTIWLLTARRLSTISPASDDIRWPGRPLRILSSFGLARIEADTFQIHRLTQAICRDHTAPAEAAAVCSDVTAVLAAADAGDPDLPNTWAAWALLTSHLTSRADPTDADQFVLFDALLGSVHYLLRSGQPREALDMCTEFHQLWARYLGEDHPDTVTWLAYLGEAKAAVGDYDEARRLAEETLERRRHILGDDHPGTLVSMHNLAHTLNALGEHSQARRLAEETLERRRRTLGDDHPSTLASVSSLARTHNALGEHFQARRLAEETLERRRHVLGDDHPSTLASMEDLAVTLGELHEYEEARRLHEDVLQRRRDLLGADHPATIASAHNLAVVLYRLRAYAESEALFQDTLARSRRVLGETHPETSGTLRFLAAVLTAMGKVYQAQKLLSSDGNRRAIRKRR